MTNRSTNQRRAMLTMLRLTLGLVQIDALWSNEHV
jgi:hypothetical protein